MSLTDQERLFSVVAKEFVVLNATRHFTENQTADAVIGLTHLFRTYDAKHFPAMADLVLRTGELAPDNLQHARTQFTYMEPAAKTLRVPDIDMATLYVALSRFGLGRGKGGTGVANLLNNSLGTLQLTEHAQQGKDAILRRMGVIDNKGNSIYFPDGKTADLFGNKPGDTGYFGALYKYEQKVGPNEFAKDAKSAFGVGGSRIAELFTDPVLIDQIFRIRKQMTDPNASLGLDNQVKTIIDQPAKRWQRAGADFQTLAAHVGKPLKPVSNAAANTLDSAIVGATRWVDAHKKLEAEVAKWITDTINETTKWVKSHEQDFKNFGSDVAYLFGEAKRTGPYIRSLGDGLFLLGGAADSALQPIKAITKVIDAIFGGYRKWAKAQTDSVKLTPAQTKALDDANRISPLQRSANEISRFLEGEARIWAKLHGWSIPDTQPTTAPASGKTSQTGQHGRKNSVTHHTSIGQVSINVNGASDAKAVAIEVRAELERMVKSPRSVLAQTGTVFTHQSVPAPLSVGVG